MKFRGRFCIAATLLIVASLLLPAPGSARQRGMKQSGQEPDVSCTIIVIVRDETGGASTQPALVEVSRMEGGVFTQRTTDAGQVQIDGLRTGLYTVKVSMAGYVTSQQTLNVTGGLVVGQFQMQPIGDAKAKSQRPPGMPILAPKAQKLADQVWIDFQKGNLESAHTSLVELYRLAPGHPDVNYLYGVYEAQIRDMVQANAYWNKAIEIYPKHVGALQQLSQAALDENKPEEAIPLASRAIEAAPASWRPHALMAQAWFQQKQYPEAVEEADRAIELGHEDASPVQPLLARALLADGNKPRAIEVLHSYLKAHPDNARVQKMLESLQATPAQSAHPPPQDSPSQPKPPTG